jgi:hypothetical protein
VVHIEIRVDGDNALDGPKDKQDVELFLAGAFKFVLLESLFTANLSHVRKSLSSMTIAKIAVTAATTYPCNDKSSIASGTKGVNTQAIGFKIKVLDNVIGRRRDGK